MMYLVTMSSRREASIEPLTMAVVRLLFHVSEDGIATSSPALAPAIPACCAPQSVTTYPVDIKRRYLVSVQAIK